MGDAELRQLELAARGGDDAAMEAWLRAIERTAPLRPKTKHLLGYLGYEPFAKEWREVIPTTRIEWVLGLGEHFGAQTLARALLAIAALDPPAPASPPTDEHQAGSLLLQLHYRQRVTEREAPLTCHGSFDLGTFLQASLHEQGVVDLLNEDQARRLTATVAETGAVALPVQLHERLLSTLSGPAGVWLGCSPANTLRLSNVPEQLAFVFALRCPQDGTNRVYAFNAMDTGAPEARHPLAVRPQDRIDRLRADFAAQYLQGLSSSPQREPEAPSTETEDSLTLPPRGIVEIPRGPASSSWASTRHCTINGWTYTLRLRVAPAPGATEEALLEELPTLLSWPPEGFGQLRLPKGSAGIRPAFGAWRVLAGGTLNRVTLPTGLDRDRCREVVVQALRAYVCDWVTAQR